MAGSTSSVSVTALANSTGTRINHKMQQHPSIQKAPSTGAFFIFRFTILSLLLATTSQAAASPCPADRISDRVRVAHIYDGDTVKLQDGRRLRFIGINTPEIEHHGKTGQPQGETARQFLEDLLNKNNKTLLLQYGYERRDHYGRYLAHVFLEDGTNIATELLSHGLATTLVIPPNTWGLHCYRRYENQARVNQLGIWALPAYQSTLSTDLPPDAQGFRVVYGQVQQISRANHGVRLSMKGALTLQISGKDMINFRRRDLEQLVGRTIEVRGWLKPVQNGLQMRIRHPAWLETLDEKPPEISSEQWTTSPGVAP